MKDYLKQILEGRNILILGYGREGRSTLSMLLSTLDNARIYVADTNEAVFEKDTLAKTGKVSILSGNEYPADLTVYDYVIKSPGIRLDDGRFIFDKEKITSQTDLFLAVYGSQTIGITGTKGKSTTSSLVYHILQSHTGKALFGGNIGIPLFDLAEQVNNESIIVSELSSHQLQYTRHAPHIGVLLNLYQEHLDHYLSFLDYQKAKFNIALNQKEGDYFIYPQSDQLIKSLVEGDKLKGVILPYYPGSSPEDKSTSGIWEEEGHYVLKTPEISGRIMKKDFRSGLRGEHNRWNAVIAGAIAFLAGVPEVVIEEAIATFKPLEHRLEFVGEYRGVKYYNDSISTIPEAAIAAIESLKPVNTLILGGFDRGIDYSVLEDFLKKGYVKNVVTTGPAGLRIFELLHEIEEIEELYFFAKFDEAVLKAMEVTPQGGICLLSPAASSYNEFKNFEERGKRFKELIGFEI